MRGHQLFAADRQLLEQTDADTCRLDGVMLEAVLPERILERGLEQGVTRERQCCPAGLNADDAVTWRVAPSAADNHTGCDLVLGFEGTQLAAIYIQESSCGPPKNLRNRFRHDGS